MDPLAGGSGMTPALSGRLHDNIEMADGDKPTDSGDQNTAEPYGPVMASPRWIPAPDSPPHSATDSPEMASNYSGHTSESFNRNCTPSRAPRYGSAKYDNLSCDQLRELRKQRGYHRQDAEAVLKTRLETLDAVGRRPPGGAEKDMGAFLSFLRKRPRGLKESRPLETPAMGANGKRPRGGG